VIHGAEGPRGMAKIGRLTSNTVFSSYPLGGEWLSEDGISTLTDLRLVFRTFSDIPSFKLYEQL
jgi:hypothetical protein